MILLGWLIGLWLPACGAVGAKGLPVPDAMDLRYLRRPASRNTALAAPDGYAPKPDIVTRGYDLPAAALYGAIVGVAAAQPRTYPAAEYRQYRQNHYVARSRVLNFPDLIMVQVNPMGADRSTIVLYSRSVYGYSDFGTNRRRLQGWLAALDTRLNHPIER